MLSHCERLSTVKQLRTPKVQDRPYFHHRAWKGTEQQYCWDYFWKTEWSLSVPS